MIVDDKIQKLKQRSLNMLNFLESERTKDPLTQDDRLKTILKNRIPDLDKNLWNMYNEIFDFEKPIMPTTKLRKMNKNKFWKDLIEFIR